MLGLLGKSPSYQYRDLQLVPKSQNIAPSTMFSFWAAKDSAGGGVSFNPTVLVVNADDTITQRQMNIAGGYYDTEAEIYDDDEGSLSYRMDSSIADDEEDMVFMDAVQDLVHDDVANGNHTPLSPGLSSMGSDYFRTRG